MVMVTNGVWDVIEKRGLRESSARWNFNAILRRRIGGEPSPDASMQLLTSL
jgi:hypothetical protein